MLTTNPAKTRAFEEAGMDVVRKAHRQASNPHDLRYLMTKAAKSGHLSQCPSGHVPVDVLPRDR